MQAHWSALEQHKSLFSYAVIAGANHILGEPGAVSEANRLTGLWLDATLDREPSPFLVRAQYRIYRSTNFAPETGFSGFHTSTLFVGLGFTIRPNN